MNSATAKVLVVGGGPAGMEAALKVAEAGREVTLIEKEPALGGTLVQQHRSFPRWENPQDLVDLKLERLGRCSNILALTGTIVASATASDAGFSVVIRRAATGEEWQEDIAVVVLATGFDLFDASCYGEYGYGIYPGVVNSLEFEEQLKQWHAAQPDALSGAQTGAEAGREAETQAGAQATTQAEAEIGVQATTHAEAETGAQADAGPARGESPTGAPPPKSVAFFKCVGSRDRVKGRPYCSKICCMYTAKQAGLVKDLFPDAKCFVFYMDYRATGKGYEEFVRSVIEEKQVKYVRGRPSKVLRSNGRLLIRAEDTLMGIPVEVEADMVVLAAAIIPREETAEIARMFGAATDEYGFLEPQFAEPVKCGDRVFFAGACGFAIETAGALQQGAAAAAGVLSLLGATERADVDQGRA
jgi:heterodisulfide reductase subunit A